MGANGYAQSCLTLNDHVSQGYRLLDDVTRSLGCVLSWGKRGLVQVPLGVLVLVWHTWFPSRLPLEGTAPYADLLGRSWRHAVPRVKDPNSSPWACCRLGGWGRSPDERQIMYSYVTTSTNVEFSGEAMGLEPPWS
jgi:hypothetical protein